MNLPKLALSFFFLLSINLAAGNTGVHASSPHHDHRHRHKQRYGFRPTKLFVFGDSYADTGNIQKSVGSSWKQPYGITFPGKPAGRFSDGRVLTDYVAKFYGIKTPIAYRWIKYAGNRLRYGVNFAYGGTGVFDTLVLEPNMTTQIDFFEKLLKDLVYNETDLHSSLFLLTVSGNDYGAYTAKGGTAQGLPAFITSLISQLAVNLKRLHGLGARRIAVAALEPLGCLPRTTFLSSFQQCNVTENTAVNFHNLLLNQGVSKLNNESGDSAYHVLDLYSTFTTVLENKGDVSAGTMKFDTPLKPCCMGISTAYSCGSVDDRGRKMYTVCNDAKSAFFWDGVHPTEAGWHAVSMALRPSLQQIC